MRDQEQDRKRRRLGSAAAAVGGLAAGAFAEREALGDLLAEEGGAGGATFPLTGIPDASLDVFDDIQPADAPSTGGDAGSGMPALRFDAPDILPVPEDVASAAEALEELPQSPEVPSTIFDVPSFVPANVEPSPEPEDDDEAADVDILL